jgi:hypothetical protein
MGAIVVESGLRRFSEPDEADAPISTPLGGREPEGEEIAVDYFTAAVGTP